MSDISRRVVLRSDCGLGQIDFINCLPITRVLRQEKPDRLSLVMGTPGDLNRQYRDKMLDLGAMSSHYFLEDGGFQLFPGISISSQGPVGSVLFFSKLPLGTFGGKERPMKIGVPRASASSIRLLHILLRECYGVEPLFVALDQPRPDEVSPEHEDLDGFLLFGDNALVSDMRMAANGSGNEFERIDLGQWWFEKYQLPMVFGVWAARKSWVAENPQDFASLSHYLANAASIGLGQQFQAVQAEAARRTGLSLMRLDHYYLKELDYSFNDQH